MTDHSDLSSLDWSWLQDTYWYVLPENLSALQFDPDDNTLNWALDQTVWHITGFQNGYFWGVSATLIQESDEQASQSTDGSRPVCFTMIGSITPEGRVYLTFIPCKAPFVAVCDNRHRQCRQI